MEGLVRGLEGFLALGDTRLHCGTVQALDDHPQGLADCSKGPS